MKWLLLIISVFCSTTVYVQPFQLTSYTVRDGLSSNDIRDLVKDNNGFLWIATGNGLNRFDGNAFDHFYNDPADRNSLPGNEIMSLYTDRHQQLWVGTLAGISRFDPVKQQFHNYYPDSTNGKCGRWFTTMEEDATGKLWVGSWYELLIFDAVSGKFQRSGWADFAAAHKPAKGNNNRIVILSLLRKSASELWVLTSYGLYSVNTLSHQFSWYPYKGVDDYYGCQLDYTDEQGNPWIGSYNNGLLQYDLLQKKWNSYLPPAPLTKSTNTFSVYGVAAFKSDTLLYAAADGPALFDKKNKKFISGNHVLPASGSSIFKSMKDNGRYWFSSPGGLICMYPPRSSFSRYTPFGEDAFINRAYALQGYPAEYILYDPKQRQVVRWNSERNIFLPLQLADGKKIGEEITGWYQHGNDCFISTDNTIYRYELAANRVTPLPLPPAIFSSNERTVRNIVFDKAGTGWIRLRTQGIVKYDPTTAHTEFVPILPPELDRSYAALQYDAAEHCLWIAIENGGLYKYAIQDGKTDHYPLYRNGDGISKGNITSLAVTPSGDLYAGDAAEGLFVCKKNSGTFTRLTMLDGLAGNNCNALLADKNGNVWVAASQGLSRYDAKNHTFFNFTQDDVLPYYLSFMSSADGKKLITCNGPSFYEWDVDAMPSGVQTAALYIRRMLVNNKPVALADEYTFSHLENTITLQAGIITNRLKDVPGLEYSVTNGDEWVKMDNSHTVSFSRLPPGRYHLWIRQKENPQWLKISIHILTPWWKHKLFLSSLFLLLLSCSVLLFQRRILSVRKAALLKQRMTEAETMALRAQMNPHFIFNCISSIDNFIQDNDKVNASAWLSKFAKLIRAILESSKNEAVPFWKDWETLQLYLELEQLRSDKAFVTELNAVPELLNGHYRVPPLVIQPFVENAIHHGILHRGDKQGKLVIQATLKDQVLIYTIEDNGIGREKAAALNAVNRLSHNSYGLQMSRERIQLFNQQQDNTVVFTDLCDSAGQPAGTRVEIKLYV